MASPAAFLLCFPLAPSRRPKPSFLLRHRRSTTAYTNDGAVLDARFSIFSIWFRELGSLTLIPSMRDFVENSAGSAFSSLSRKA